LKGAETIVNRPSQSSTARFKELFHMLPILRWSWCGYFGALHKGYLEQNVPAPMISCVSRKP